MKRLMINTFAFLVILGGSFILSPSSSAMNSTIKALDKCGQCETNDPDKCCSVRSDGSCYTFKCEELEQE